MATATKTTKVKLPAPHSPGQQDVLDWTGHGVALCGRRWGKTEVAVLKLFTRASTAPGLYWWVGLSWRSASMKRAWRLLKAHTRAVWRAIGERPDRYIRESEKELRLPGGGEIWLRTAERPDSLAGEGVRGVVLDEFTLMDEKVWTEFVAPTLVDYGGWALFIGVPKGLSWATRLWQTAKTRAGWRAWQFTSYDNPLLDARLIDDLAVGLPERLRRQEIYAEVIDDSGAVFRRVVELATATAQERAVAGHVYAMGVDWARSHDSTVFTVIDVTTAELVYLDIMTGVDYELQTARLKGVVERFAPAVIIAEANSMGQPLIERLQRNGLPVKGFVTTGPSKAVIIDALALAFETEAIRILPDETLITELMAFESTTTANGAPKFGAPSGMHDDTVMSLALAWSGAGRRAAALEVGPNLFYGGES